MRLTVALASSLVIALVAAGGAQTPAATKLAGTLDCPKTDPVAMSEVGDAPGHAFTLFKIKCTWSKGEIAGVKMQTEEDTFVSEASGTTARDAGYGVTTLVGGDKVFVKFEGTTTMKNNVAASGEGTWTFTGGTGKAKGAKGKGTYKGTVKPDGSISWQVDGEYSVGATSGK